MSQPDDALTTELLDRIGAGDSSAADQLMPLVYDELRRLAQHLLGKHPPNHALQATALVHEAYLRLIGQENPHYKNRAHFFSIAAMMVRRALVDHIRAAAAQKRGGGGERITLHDGVALTGTKDRALDMLSLHDALTTLETSYARPSRVVELRFFAGLTVEETAEVLDISPRTVKGDWRFAKAWLRARLQSDPHDE